MATDAAQNLESEDTETEDPESEAAVERDIAAAAELERSIESDPSLMPVGRSSLQVESTVLDPEEVQALLGGLTALLRSAEATGDFPAEGHPLAGSARAIAEFGVADRWSSDRFGERPHSEGNEHEPDAKTNRRDRRYSQLSPFAWLFPDDAGIGRSARHQQSHHLRARGRTRKKASSPPGQAQGSLFGNHL